MNTIDLKYKINDTVLYRTDDFSTVYYGEIKKFFVSSDLNNEVKICYVIENSNTKEFDTVAEEKIIAIANNVTRKEVMRGAIAEAYAESILKSLNLKIKVIKIEFCGNKTAISYKANNSTTIRKEISECHPEDTFEKSKGVLVCLCKISIKMLEEIIKGM